MLETGKTYKLFHFSNFLLFVISAVAYCVTGSLLFLALPFSFVLFTYGWLKPLQFFLSLVFIIPFSFEYNFTRDFGTDIPDEGMMIMLTALMAFYGYNRRTELHNFTREPLAVVLIFHLLWILITGIFSTEPVLSFKYLAAKSWYAVAFVIAPLLLVRAQHHIRLVAKFYTAAMMIMMLFALGRHYDFGFTFADINEALVPFFRNHVTYSAALVCTLPVLLAAFLLSRKTNRFLYIVLLGVVLLALFFSYSRGAWLAVGSGLLAWVLARYRLLLASYIAGIILVIGLVFFLSKEDRYLDYAHDYTTTVFHEDFSQHLVATYKLKDVSTAERFYRWIAAARMIKDAPILGTGPSTFYSSYRPYTVSSFRTWVSDNRERSTVHNYFLLVATEQGLPGLFLFLVLVGLMLWYAEFIYRNSTDRFYRLSSLAIGSIIVMLLTVNFLSDLIETDKTGSVFFICLALLVIMKRNITSHSAHHANHSQED